MATGTIITQTALMKKVRPNSWAYLFFAWECYFCYIMLTMLEYEFGLPGHNWMMLIASIGVWVSILMYVCEMARRVGIIVPHGAKFCLMMTYPITVPILWLYVRGWRVVLDVLLLFVGMVIAFLLAYGCAWGLYLLG